MSTISFLTVVRPSSNKSSGHVLAKEEKQDETILKKGTVNVCQNDYSEKKNQTKAHKTQRNNPIQRDLISFVVWVENGSSCDCGSLSRRTAF